MWKERNILMMGKENCDRLRNSKVLVVGVGGVGAYAAEMIVRAGVGHIVIVDNDVVTETNINRQLIALRSTVGHSKVEVLRERLLDINPEADVEARQLYLKDELTEALLDQEHYDYVVDAIDTLTPKVFLIFAARQRNIPIVSSMGSGGKFDPTRVRIDDVSKSNYCKLARMVRKRLHHLGIRSGFKVVYSDEVVDRDKIEITENELNKHSNVGTISYMPAVFGCLMASVVIRDIILLK
ncbi:MAG: tRNA threonylcarbamoyladenosine dehydratase [bacterium]|nr:tRNA threonylcarbamoyladenosine dehydratase [Candidatus Minthenecus merdequi]